MQTLVQLHTCDLADNIFESATITSGCACIAERIADIISLGNSGISGAATAVIADSKYTSTPILHIASFTQILSNFASNPSSAFNIQLCPFKLQPFNFKERRYQSDYH